MSNGYINPIFQLFDTQVDDSSISSMQWIRFTPEQSNLANQSTISIRTKDLDSYLWLSNAYLSVDFHLSDAANGQTITDANQYLLGEHLVAIFSKMTLNLNSVEINQCDLPAMSQQILQLLRYSQDYQDKFGRSLGMFFDDGVNAAAAKASAVATRRAFIRSVGVPNRINFRIPLDMIFGFCDSFKGVLRGVEIKMDLVKESSSSKYLFGDDAACPAGTKAFIDNIELWIQKITPSLQSEQYYLEALSGDKTQTIVYEDWNTYISNKFIAPVNKLSQQIQSTSRKARYIFVGLKRATRLDGYAETPENHPTLYDNLSVKQIRLRINSEVLPREPIQINFVASTLNEAQNVLRSYIDFTSLMGAQEEDNGGLLSLDNWRDVHTIFAFDLSNEKPSLWQNVNQNYIEVVIDQMDSGAAAAANDFYLVSTVCWERELQMSASNRSLVLKRV